MHEGLAVWYRTGDPVAALTAISEKWPPNMPVDDFRTKEKCIKTMLEYIKVYAHESWTVVGLAEGSPIVEVPFTLDTGMFLPCERCLDLDVDPYGAVCDNCGAPRESIEYGGIYDLLVEFGGNLFVVDHKTTSVMGSGYFNQFKPNNQMTGYIWAASAMSGKKVNGAIINAVGIYKSGTTKFEREITSRSPNAVEEWLLNLWHECVNIQRCTHADFWPRRTNACTLYGLCEFHSVCSLDHPTERAKRLEADYVRDKWDFENRD